MNKWCQDHGFVLGFIALFSMVIMFGIEQWRMPEQLRGGVMNKLEAIYAQQWLTREYISQINSQDWVTAVNTPMPKLMKESQK